MVFVIDIDGTVADNDHRQGFVQGNKKDWDAFYNPDLMQKDAPIAKAQQVIARIADYKHRIIFLTGRPERTRAVTWAWLHQHLGLCPTREELLMRGDNDWRQANIYKADWAKRMYAHLGGKPMPPGTWPGDYFGIVFIDDDKRALPSYWDYGIALEAPGCWDTFNLENLKP